MTQLLVSSDGGYLVTAAADTNVHVYNMADPCQSGFFCSPKNETRMMDGEEHDDEHGDDAGDDYYYSTSTVSLLLLLFSSSLSSLLSLLSLYTYKFSLLLSLLRLSSLLYCDDDNDDQKTAKDVFSEPTGHPKPFHSWAGGCRSLDGRRSAGLN